MVRARPLRTALIALVASLASTAAARSAPADQSPWVLPWLRDYAGGAFEEVVERLQPMGDPVQLEKDLELIVKPWTTAKGIDVERQRRAIAAFALEAAYVRLDRPAGAARLVEWGCRQIRRIPKARAGDFERYWFLAAFALLSGTVDPEAMESHVGHVRLIFPDEPRLAFERAVAGELRAAPFFEDGRASPSDVQKRYAEAAKRYREAAKVESVKAEAHVRLARVELELGHADLAFEALQDVESATNDPAIIYLARLFRGRALEELERDDAALEAYHSALEVVPGAQSGVMALASLHFRQGRYAMAESLVDELVSRPTPAIDPWWSYWPADFRHIDFLIAGMRKALK